MPTRRSDSTASRALTLSVVAALTAYACGGEESAATSTAGGGGAGGAVTTPEPPPEPPPPAEARALWDEPSFELRSDPAVPYQAGQEGHVGIRLTARGHHHVNQDYPISVQITAPDGVTLPRATLARGDAAEFSEALARFDVPFTAPAGHHELRALVDFAVCTPESCMPDTRTLAIAVDVP